jgi:hypothetical protein
MNQEISQSQKYYTSTDDAGNEIFLRRTEIVTVEETRYSWQKKTLQRILSGNEDAFREDAIQKSLAALRNRVDGTAKIYAEDSEDGIPTGVLEFETWENTATTDEIKRAVEQ